MIFARRSKFTCNIHVQPPSLLTTSPDNAWPPGTSKVNDGMWFERFYLLGYRSLGCEITLQHHGWLSTFESQPTHFPGDFLCKGFQQMPAQKTSCPRDQDTALAS